MSAELLALLDQELADPEPERCERLMRRILEEAPSLPREQVAALHARIGQVVEALGKRIQATREALDAAAEGRRALRGYGHLRSHHLAQRLYRKA